MEKKYYRGIQEIFKNEIENPSDEFVKFFARQMQMTAKIIEEFRMHIKKSFKEIITTTVRILYRKVDTCKFWSRA